MLLKSTQQQQVHFHRYNYVRFLILTFHVFFIFASLHYQLSTAKAVVRDLFVDAPPSSQPPYYLINGAENPVLNLSRGIIYRFFLDAPSQPFFILDNHGSVYDRGVSGDFGHALGAFLWEVPLDAPPKLAYASGNDEQTMGNTIFITDGAPHLRVTFSSTEILHETNLTIPSPHIPSPLTFTLTNTGTADLSFLSPPSLLPVEGSQVQEGLSLSGPALTITTLAPGESTTVMIQFVEPFNATMILRSNDVQVYYAVNVVVLPSTLSVPMCEWGDWSEWSSCSASCGGGVVRKTRQCTCERSVSGVGSIEEDRCVQQMQVAEAPCSEWVCELNLAEMWSCEWDSWSKWSSCSAECGKGETWRKMICNCPHLKPSEYDYSFCEDNQPEEVLPCNTQDCCTWGDFGPWSACSEPCPGGVRVRSQMCTCSPEAYLYGFDETTCLGQPTQEEQFCSVGNCCEWTWKQWGACNGTCKSGRKRFREQYCLCENITYHKNNSCPGNPRVEDVACNDGEEGVTCPHLPDYWKLHKQWPSTSTSSISCFDQSSDSPTEPQVFLWTTILSHPSDDTWYTLARYAIAASLSCAGGAYCPYSVRTTIDSSFKLLSVSCEYFSNATEMQDVLPLVSFLSLYTSGDTELFRGSAVAEGDAALRITNEGGGGNGKGLSGDRYPGLVLGLSLAGVTVVLLIVAVWVGVRVFKRGGVVMVGGRGGLLAGGRGRGGAGDSTPSGGTSEGEEVDLQQLRNHTIEELKTESDEPDALDVTTLEELHL